MWAKMASAFRKPNATIGVSPSLWSSSAPAKIPNVGEFLYFWPSTNDSASETFFFPFLAEVSLAEVFLPLGFFFVSASLLLADEALALPLDEAEALLLAEALAELLEEEDADDEEEEAAFFFLVIAMV